MTQPYLPQFSRSTPSPTDHVTAAFEEALPLFRCRCFSQEIKIFFRSCTSFVWAALPFDILSCYDPEKNWTKLGRNFSIKRVLPFADKRHRNELLTIITMERKKTRTLLIVKFQLWHERRPSDLTFYSSVNKNTLSLKRWVIYCLTKEERAKIFHQYFSTSRDILR